MKRAAKAAFVPKVFLAKVGKGRTLTEYKKNQRIFSQGDPADAIFYIQAGKVKLTVVCKQGKEAVVAIWGAKDFFGEGCVAGPPLRMPAPPPCQTAQLCGWKSRVWFVCSTTSPPFLSCSFKTYSPAIFESRRTWWISYSTPARSGWHACCF
jgi:hypothetical protein